jgi:hypothetical protein
MVFEDWHTPSRGGGQEASPKPGNGRRRKMRQHSIHLALTVLLSLVPVTGAWGYTDLGVAEGTVSEELYVDISVPGNDVLDSWRITLSLPDQGGVTGISEVTIVQSRRVAPWWSDEAIVSHTQRGLAVICALANVAWKVAIRLVPVPAIH